jgi:hypothetical protein
MRSPIRPEGLTKYAPRWVREGTAKPSHLPPAAQLPPIESGEPPWRGPSPFHDDGSDPAFDGDVRRWRNDQPLEPQLSHQLPLPGSFSHRLDAIERLFRSAALFAFAVIAMGALGMLLFPDAPKEAAKIGSQFAATAAPERPMTQSVSQYEKRPAAKSNSRVAYEEPRAPAPVEIVKPRPVPVQVEAPAAPAPAPAAAAPVPYVVANVVPAPQPPAPQQPAFQAASQPVAPSTAQPQRVVHSQRILSPDELDRLMKRGETFLEQGDIAAARLVFARAAEARDPKAALALGSTYDPTVLQKMGVVGVQADADIARSWYERAAEFGSDDAAPRISALAQLNR